MSDKPTLIRRRLQPVSSRPSSTLKAVLGSDESLPKAPGSVEPQAGFGQVVMLTDSRTQAREDALRLNHANEVVRRASLLTGLFCWLLAPFTSRLRLLHARFDALEGKIIAILGDRQAAVENKELAERCAHLEATLAAERTLHAQQFAEQRDRAVRLRNVLLEVGKRKALLILAEVAAGKPGDREKAVGLIDATEKLVQQTLSMDAEVFGAPAPDTESPSESETKK